MMTEIPITFEFKIVAQGGGDPSQDIEETILEWPDVRPCSVLVDDEKAAYIEFGTGPARNTSRKYVDKVSPVEMKFREWVRKKKGISDPAICNSMAREYYKRAMEKGMPPMPFFRTSYYRVMDEIAPYPDKPSDWLKTGTIESLAEYIASTMVDIIYDLDMVYTGELAESIRVERRDIEGPRLGTLETISTSPDLWDDPELGVNGKRPPQRFYGV